MKKVISVLMIAVLAVACMVLPAFAAETATVSVSTETAAYGETVTLSVSVDEATFATYGIKVSYDAEALEVVAVEQGEASKGLFSNGINAEGKFSGIVGMIDTKDSTVSGVLFTVTFKVLTTVEGTYEVSVEIDNVSKANTSAVEVEAEAGAVEVKCNHAWGEWVETKPATHTEAGLKTRTCSICGAVEEEEIPTTEGHEWDEGVVTKEATCGEAGELTYTCACGETKVETIPATGEHSWNEGVVTKEATCEEDGEMTYTCTVCGETEVETIPAVGEHAWGEWVETKPATHTETGLMTRTCSICGATEEEEIAATEEHEWDEGVVTKEPTCVEAGEMTYTCACGETKVEAIPATGEHTWSEWKADAENHWHECTVCGGVADKDVHEFGDDNTCDECGYTKDEPTPPPATGDAEQMILLAMFAVMAMAGATVLISKRKFF